GIETLDQALGIVEAIDPDDEETAAEACHHLLYQGGPHVAARQPLEYTRLDADWKISDPRLSSVQAQSGLMTVDLQYTHLPGLVPLGDQVANKIARITLGLKPHNVILHEQRNQLLMVRQRGQHFGGRERNMQEKPDPIGMASPP